jgi:hypothetical protein
MSTGHPIITGPAGEAFSAWCEDPSTTNALSREAREECASTARAWLALPSIIDPSDPADAPLPAYLRAWIDALAESTCALCGAAPAIVGVDPSDFPCGEPTCAECVRSAMARAVGEVDRLTREGTDDMEMSESQAYVSHLRAILDGVSCPEEDWYYAVSLDGVFVDSPDAVGLNVAEWVFMSESRAMAHARALRREHGDDVPVCVHPYVDTERS